jgi:hypothetical protein
VDVLRDDCSNRRRRRRRYSSKCSVRPTHHHNERASERTIRRRGVGEGGRTGGEVDGVARGGGERRRTARRDGRRQHLRQEAKHRPPCVSPRTIQQRRMVSIRFDSILLQHALARCRNDRSYVTSGLSQLQVCEIKKIIDATITDRPNEKKYKQTNKNESKKNTRTSKRRRHARRTHLMTNEIDQHQS